MSSSRPLKYRQKEALAYLRQFPNEWVTSSKMTSILTRISEMELSK